MSRENIPACLKCERVEMLPRSLALAAGAITKNVYTDKDNTFTSVQKLGKMNTPAL